jgi:hypothetical protein
MKENKSIIQSTHRHIKDLLPPLLESLSEKMEQKPDLVMAAWPEIVGKRIAAMTKAVSYESGVLRVLVNNSTLYSLLVEHEKVRLLGKLKKRFPSLPIRNIFFKVG